MEAKLTHTRRDFLLSGTTAGGLFLAGYPALAVTAAEPPGQPQKENAEEEISPAEDLMREHAVLERILLIFEDCAQRLKDNGALNFAALANTAKIVRAFIEDYHSKLEEDHIFPRFEETGKLVPLVKLLREQHHAGRQLTDRILQYRNLNEQNGKNLLRDLNQFVRMYRPHIAREGTDVFPALRSVVKPADYDKMGEQFEDLEHKLFGENGFESVVEKVADIEKQLGIYELLKFSPKA
jgi:hemerythrin-like domain-containing protein